MLATLKDAVVSVTHSANGVSRSAAARMRHQHDEMYQKTKDKRHSELANVYLQLSRGYKLISINKAMETAGVKPDGLPVLAIANAAARWVWYEYDAGMTLDPDGKWRHPMAAFVSDYSINPGHNTRGFSAARKTDLFRFNRKLFPVRPDGKPVARVPIVPPKHLPRGALKNYQILWEADWKKAPVDPLLLRRVSRDFFIVLAEWDMSPIERLVLEMGSFAGE
jgi:hypothetical protein